LLRPTESGNRSPQQSEEVARLVVQTTDRVSAADIDQVESLGGRIINPSIQAFNGMIIELPVAAIEQFALSQRIGRISMDRSMRILGQGLFKRVTGDNGANATTSHLEKTTGAYQLYPWNNLFNIGVDGTGIGIAIVDSGISSASDFDSSHMSTFGSGMKLGNTRIDSGINFADDQFVSDGLGHGTHVAGIAGGNGAQSYGSGNFYGGIAPGANLYNLRVFTNDGEGHVSNVLAAIDWILANHASENIRVVNMSLGTPVVESYKTDPLCIAVEKMVK